MLEKHFCSSPWYHLRIRYDGSYTYCRWGKDDTNHSYNISTHTFGEFINSDAMCDVRMKLLKGKQPNGCMNCKKSENSGQLTGRQKQLLKSGIRLEEFKNTLLSSPHLGWFSEALDNNGEITPRIVDLQIDLSNVCNNACIMCSPKSSTKLGKDFIKLHKISPDLFYKPEKIHNNWASDKIVLQKFIDDLLLYKDDIKYIHFLGGETLYVEEFYTICEALIDAGISKNIIVGTTTNGTVFNERLKNIMSEFKEFHLGISIETTTPLNDYIRYGSEIDKVLSNMDQFLMLREEFENLYLVLRNTFSSLSIFHSDKLVEYMIENEISSESCDVLQWPECMMVELLPKDIKRDIKKRLRLLIDRINVPTTEVNANVRIRGNELEQIVRVTNELIQLLSIPVEENEDVEKKRHDLVRFLKSFEQLRDNKILEYIPEYEEFLRNYGY